MSLMQRRVTIEAWILGLIAVLGVLIFVIVQMLPGLDVGAWRWILSGAGVIVAGVAVIAAFRNKSDNAPPFRKVRFFNTTDRTVKKVKIEREPREELNNQPDLPSVRAGELAIKDATPEDPFNTKAERLAVRITVEDPADPRGPGLKYSCDVASNGAGCIEELDMVLSGANGDYGGAAFGLCAPNNDQPLTSTAPVPIVVA